MRLLYIANIRLPTEKAHGIQIMKTCEALAKQGVKVELMVPTRVNEHRGSPFDFYGVAQCFKLHRVKSIDFLAMPLWKPLAFLLQSLSFFLAVKRYIGFSLADIYYTRDLVVAFFLPSSYRPVFYEIHTMPKRPTFFHRRAWRQCAGLIVISDGLRQALVAEGIPAEKILLARDAVDVEKFTVPESKAESRRRLQLPLDQRIVLYTGHLYEWKGAGILAEAAAFLPAHIQVYLVGGTPDDIQTFREKYWATNLHIVGWQPHGLIPYWLQAADLLVLPTSAAETIGARYTSPLKLFEYLSSGTPIIAAQLASLQEVVQGNEVVFFQPDNAGDLAEKIKVSIEQQWDQLNKAAALVALRIAPKHSWNNRAKLILSFLPKS